MSERLPKTDNRPLRNQEASYCPTCKRFTEQTRGRERGERHCWSCGNNFTLDESRQAEAREKLAPHWTCALCEQPLGGFAAVKAHQCPVRLARR